MALDRHHLARIHILKSSAKLTDAEYRKLLLDNAGVMSAKDINSFDIYDKVIHALEVKSGSSFSYKEKKELKPIITIPSFMPKEDPWTWYDATPEQWEKMGELIERADKKGWTLVAVHDSDGSKKFKMRYRQW